MPAACPLVIPMVPPSLIAFWFLKSLPQHLLSQRVTHVPMVSEESMPVFMFVLETQLWPHCALVILAHSMKVNLAPLTHFFFRVSTFIYNNLSYFFPFLIQLRCIFSLSFTFMQFHQTQFSCGLTFHCLLLFYLIIYILLPSFLFLVY